MKLEATKQEFIKFRAEGYSFDAISEKIDVSKSTLIEWAREFDLEIHNLKAINYEATLVQYRLTKQFKIENLAKVLDKIEKELESRSFEEIPISKLVDMKFKMLDRLDAETSQNKLSVLKNNNGLMEIDYGINAFALD